MYIVEKWAACKFSLAFGYGGEDGAELRQGGYNENYGCEHPEIIRSGRFPTTDFFDRTTWLKAVILHGLGKYNDPEVIEALTLSCATCAFFRHK